MFYGFSIEQAMVESIVIKSNI